MNTHTSVNPAVRGWTVQQTIGVGVVKEPPGRATIPDRGGWDDYEGRAVSRSSLGWLGVDGFHRVERTVTNPD